MELLKGKRRTIRGEDLNEQVFVHWSKLARVTTDGLPNLTGKNVELLKRTQIKVKEGKT